jgi:Plavaka transposase
MALLEMSLYVPNHFSTLSHIYLVTDIQSFTEDFPCADIHKLIAPDLLHQVIKGAFKNHLVTWIQEWIEANQGKKVAKQVLSSIDHW